MRKMIQNERILKEDTLEETLQSKQVRDVIKGEETKTELESANAKEKEENEETIDGIWEYITTTSTLRQNSIGEMSRFENDLIETNIKLRKLEENSNTLKKIVNDTFLEKQTLESVAVADEKALQLLIGFSRYETISIEKIKENITNSSEWLSFMLLAQAGLIKLKGSYVYLTDRGNDILWLFLRDDLEFKEK